jgi:acetyl-CoA carboxylase biotin carboxyl carrier protein
VGRDLEAVRRILAAFEASDWATIDVRFGDVRVVLSASGGADSAADDPPAAGDPVTEAEERAPDPMPSPPPDDIEVVPGTVPVVSPSPGIFWRSPEPGAPPFVDVGTVVEPSSTVCVVEIMKLMNHVKAGVSGRITRVWASNGEPVEKGTLLFAVAPPGP